MRRPAPVVNQFGLGLGPALAASLVLTGTAAAADLGAAVGPDPDRVETAAGLRAVLEGWSDNSDRGDLDGDGLVDTRDLIHALSGGAARVVVGPVAAASGGTPFLGISCDRFVGDEWVENGYAGLVTYRLYADFADFGDAGVLAAFGIREHGMTWNSADGVFANDEVFGGLTAPLDLRDVGIWTNQWDTYVTINVTEAAGDRTSVSPGFFDETNGLGSDFTTFNAGWFSTPDDPQTRAIDGRVLIAQITVDEGVEVGGVLAVLTRDRLSIFELPFFCGAPGSTGACCLSAFNCRPASESFCAAIGGTFLGVGTECDTQFIETPCHPGDNAQHCVQYVATCPQGGDAGGECIPGPLVDAWLSPDGEDGEPTSFHDFGGDGQAIPADFFDAGSDPFTDIVLLTSVPLGPVDLGPYGGEVVEFGDADTIVLRSADPFDRCSLPTEDESAVAADVIALSLESLDPLVVTFDGEDPQLWDLEVALSEVVPATGMLTAVKNSCNGGTYSIEALLVQPLFTFTARDDPKLERVLDTGRAGIPPVTLTLDDADWVTDLAPNLDAPSPYCTAFHPGVTDVDPVYECDCNTNQQRDVCDIEQEISLDCNVNAIPDECEIAEGSRDCNGNGVLDECECPGDVSGNCVVDLDDINAILTAWGPCEGCPEDLDGNGRVDYAEILTILIGWGPCGG